MNINYYDMKKLIFTALGVLACSAYASADVTVRFADNQPDTLYSVEHMLISDMVKSRAERPMPIIDTLQSKAGILSFKLDSDAPALYMVRKLNDRQGAQFYAAPNEKLAIIFNSNDPVDYIVTGSKLMDGVTEIKQQMNDVMKQYQALNSAANKDETAINNLVQKYEAIAPSYLAANPNNPAALYALLNMDGEAFMNAFNNLNADMQKEILYPLVENHKQYVERSIAADKKLHDLQAGNVPAPNFTLKDLQGKEVSLSDFKGKWVILDFWGSWCGWCIKGMPALKDAYEQYKPELEVIGIDCNETEDRWRKAVEKYQLPWVHVYNPATSSLLSDYGVTGFPTKAIINPEGKIANITVGEDPSFFDTLARLMTK